MQKKNTASDEWSTRHDSVIQNVWYCIRNTSRCYCLLLYWCGISILVNAALPVLSAYLPKAVIEAITEGNSVWELTATVLAFMGVIALLSGPASFLQNSFIIKNIG